MPDSSNLYSFYAKAFNFDLFSLSDRQHCFFSTWHPSLVTPRILIRNNALEGYSHRSSSWPPSTILLQDYSTRTVARTATQSTWSTLRTLGVNALPLPLTAGFSPPASESPS